MALSHMCAMAAAAAAATAGRSSSSSSSASGSSSPRLSKPNILLFLTDDQDLELGSMGAMPFAREQLVERGTRLSNFFAHTPVCCPSRSELLSGRYFQNIRVATAADKGCMRVNVTDAFHNSTLAVPLHAAGYTTGLFGKYLNGGGPKYLCPVSNKTSGGEGQYAPFRPLGWDRFFGMCPDDCYEDCLFVDNGIGRRYDDKGFVNGSNYATSVIGNATVQWLSEALRQQQHGSAEAPALPIFAYIAPHAPHTSPAGQSMVAPWYKHAFARDGIRAPRTAGYGLAAPDHHWLVAAQPELTVSVKLQMDVLALMRWQALLSVEDMLKEIFAVVEEYSAMDRTFFLYTSDHGFHMGQHNLAADKREPYETDIRIPFFIRGPGVAEGRELPQVTGMVDIPPTIMALAGLPVVSESWDGQSFAGLVTAGQILDRVSKTWTRQEYLIAYMACSQQPKVSPNDGGHAKDAGNNTFIGLRIINETSNLAYYEFTDAYKDWNFEAVEFYELYDLVSDPHQLHNQYYRGSFSPGVKHELHERLREAWACQGSGCDTTARIFNETRLPRKTDDVGDVSVAFSAVSKPEQSLRRQLLVDISKPVNVVDARFTSITYDIGGLNRPLLPLVPRLRDLARAGQTYLRVGGAAGDCIYWNVSNNVDLPLPAPSTRCINEGSRRVASRQVVDELLELCHSAGVLLVLGLNSADGRNKTHHSWQPGHTTALLRYLASHELRFVVGGFELGNEPRSEKYGFRLTGDELGHDIVTLRQLVRETFGPENEPMLVGPDQDQDQDCVVPHTEGRCIPCFLDWCWRDTESCIDTARSALSAITFHYYPLKEGLPYNGSRLLMQPALLDKVQQRVAPYNKLASSGSKRLPVWLGEGASAGHGGIDNVSNAFESGFYYLDELGQLARLGVSVMCRQQLSADGYGLTTKALEPMPDFFTAILHKRLLGTTVLNSTVVMTGSGDDGMVRAYAHCGRRSSGTVALVFINLLPSLVTLQLPTELMAATSREEWHLTADELSSRTMLLNGRVLELTSTGDLPEMPSVTHNTGSDVLRVNGTSYGFVVFELGPNAESVCSRAQSLPALKTTDVSSVIDHKNAAVGSRLDVVPGSSTPMTCGVALTASRCTVRGRASCWACVNKHAEALHQAGCNDSALTSWCQYGTCSEAGAFASTQYCNLTASLDARVEALVDAATLSEKLSMLPATNDGISRLGVPAFMYTECLHGLKIDCDEDGEACPSIFPAPIALAAALNDSLWKSIGSTIGTENRALYNTGGVSQVAFPYCWAPNINIARDGRWGRVGETAGEDILLTKRYMLAWVDGLQRGGSGSSDGPDLALATCKHWSGYSLEGQIKKTASGPPGTYPSRHSFDALTTKQDLVDFYFPVFESCAKDIDIPSIMCSYNSVAIEGESSRGVPSCANSKFNNGILRARWNFSGLMVSDCTAIADFTGHNSKCKPNCPLGHNFSRSNVDAVAAAMTGGTDTNCGNPNFYQLYLAKAVADGLVDKGKVDLAFGRVVRMILRLGLLDLDMPYDHLNDEHVGLPSSDALCAEAARQSVVLLRNRNDVALPIVLTSDSTKSLALVGPHANTTTRLLGMYVGSGNRLITQRSALSVIRDRLPGHQVRYAPGMSSLESTDTSGFAAAVEAAQGATTVVVMLGLCEQGHGCTEHENQDRSTLSLPTTQLALLKAVSAVAASTNVVCVFISGGPLSVDALDELCDAALWTGYPGQAGAIGIADVLFGATSPTAVLPYTLHFSNFTKSRPMTDMAVRPRGSQPGVTYRWFGDNPVLRPFGFGLSLGRFAWSWVSSAAERTRSPPLPRVLTVAAVAAAAKHRTTVTTYEVAALRLQAPADRHLGTAAIGVSALGYVEASLGDGEGRRLFAFAKLEQLLVGQSRTLEMQLEAASLSTVEQDGSRWVKPGCFNVSVRAAGLELPVLSSTLELTGQPVLVEESPF